MRKLKIEEVKGLRQAVELAFRADLPHSKGCLFNHMLYCITTEMTVYVGGSKTENLSKPRESLYSQQSGYLFPVLDSHSSTGNSQFSFLGGTLYTESTASPSAMPQGSISFPTNSSPHWCLLSSSTDNFCLCWQHRTVSTYFKIPYHPFFWNTQFNTFLQSCLSPQVLRVCEIHFRLCLIFFQPIFYSNFCCSNQMYPGITRQGFSLSWTMNLSCFLAWASQMTWLDICRNLLSTHTYTNLDIQRDSCPLRQRFTNKDRNW